MGAGKTVVRVQLWDSEMGSGQGHATGRQAGRQPGRALPLFTMYLAVFGGGGNLTVAIRQNAGFVVQVTVFDHSLTSFIPSSSLLFPHTVPPELWYLCCAF